MPTTPATKPAHTPEPWHSTYFGSGNSSRRNAAVVTGPWGVPVADIPTSYACEGANAARIVDCVNACAGIPDPAAAIQKARETLAYLAKVHRQHGPGFLGQKFADQVTAALRALGEA